MSDDVNETIDRLTGPYPAEWLASDKATPALRKLAIAFETQRAEIAALHDSIERHILKIAALRSRLSAAELALINLTARLARGAAVAAESAVAP